MFQGSCSECGCVQCNCNQNGRLIKGNTVNNLAVSNTTTIPGPEGPEGDTYVPTESDDVFTD